MGIIKDIKGRRFGNLVAINRVGSDRLGHSLWECKCDCGKIIVNLSNRLLTGNSGTCGCRNGHGMRYTRVYRTWTNMKSRCYDPRQKSYKHYGKVGILVCDKWKENFKEFLIWSKRTGYSDNLTIDRIDPKGNYSPENCQWLTMTENVKRKEISKETREKMSKSRIGKIPWNKGMKKT